MITVTLPPTNITGAGKLHILSIYRATAKLSGDNSTLSQQARSLAMANRNTTLLEAFEEDLLKQLEPLHKKGDRLILAGDFNCNMRNETMLKLQQKLSLTDVMAESMEQTTPTREHGSSTIDHILISNQLMQAVTRAEYLPFKYGIFTDHRALIMDLSMTKLRARQDTEPQKRGKKLNSKVCATASTYKTELTNYLRDSGQVEKLFGTSKPKDRKSRRKAIRRLELFDRKQTKTMLQA